MYRALLLWCLLSLYLVDRCFYVCLGFRAEYGLVLVVLLLAVAFLVLFHRLTWLSQQLSFPRRFAL